MRGVWFTNVCKQRRIHAQENLVTTIFKSPSGDRLIVDFPYHPATLERIRSVSGRRFDPKGKVWSVPFSAHHVEELRRVFPDAMWAEDAKREIETQTAFFPLAEMDPVTLGAIPGFKSDAPRLMDFQKQGVLFCAANKRVLLADDMGCGKSVQALGAVSKASASDVLVVCPKFLITNWGLEIRKWTGTDALLLGSGEDLQDLRKMPPSVFSMMVAKHRFVVINYDLLHKYPAIMSRVWDALIVDECSMIKSHVSKRSKAVRAIKSKMALLLSGTPIINRPIELWPALDYISGGQFGGYYEFGEKFCSGGVKQIPLGVFCPDCDVRRRTVKGPCFSCASPQNARVKFREVKDFNGASNLDELRERMLKFMISRKKSDVLRDLADGMRIDKVVQLDDTVMDAYELAVTNLMAYLVDVKGKDIESSMRSCFNEALTRVGYLRQLLSLGKVGIAAEEITEVIDGGDSCVAFSCYKETVYALEEAIQALATANGGKPRPVFIHNGDLSRADRAMAIAKFNATPGSVLICTIQSAGMGLNLTAGNYAFFLDLPWTPAEIFQAEARIHRFGQVKGVSFIRYFASGTYDQILMEKLGEKQGIFNILMGDDASVSGQQAGSDAIDTHPLLAEVLRKFMVSARARRSKA